MTMRFLRYDASKDTLPEWSVKLDHCYHDKSRGIHVRCGMRCYYWIWRLCK